MESHSMFQFHDELYHLVVKRRYGEALALLNNAERPAYIHRVEFRRALSELCSLLNPKPEAVAVGAAIVRLNPDLVGTVLHVCVGSKRAFDFTKGSYQPLPRSADMALTLIRANPDAIMLYRDGKTPLHVACEANADVSVIQAMVQARPEAALRMIRSEQGALSHMTPFHLVCRVGVDLPLLKVFLEVHPTLATLQYREDKRPIDLLWKNKASLEKIALILATGHHGRVIDPLPMHHLLHFACSQPCPWELVADILERFPLQASQRDDRGNLPLHYAVRNRHLMFQVTVPQRKRKREREEPVPVRHTVVTTWSTDLISNLVAAYPNALYELDSTHGLPPFLLSALQMNERPVPITYQLLRATPEVVQRALQREGEMVSPLNAAVERVRLEADEPAAKQPRLD